jgi:hypothetical protein
MPRARRPGTHRRRRRPGTHGQLRDRRGVRGRPGKLCLECEHGELRGPGTWWEGTLGTPGALLAVLWNLLSRQPDGGWQSCQLSTDGLSPHYEPVITRPPSQGLAPQRQGKPRRFVPSCLHAAAAAPGLQANGMGLSGAAAAAAPPGAAAAGGSPRGRGGAAPAGGEAGSSAAGGDDGFWDRQVEVPAELDMPMSSQVCTACRAAAECMPSWMMLGIRCSNPSAELDMPLNAQVRARAGLRSARPQAKAPLCTLLICSIEGIIMSACVVVFWLAGAGTSPAYPPHQASLLAHRVYYV